MNWDRIEGNWKQFRGKVREQWGKLTDDDLDVINGKREQLVGRIQSRYGAAKDAVERDVDAFTRRIKDDQIDLDRPEADVTTRPITERTPRHI